MSEAKEIVLPSGRFASFRPITLGDVIVSHSEIGPRMMAIMATLVCEIDDEPVTAEQVLAMTLDEFMPIANVIADMMPKDMASKGVA